MSEEKRKRRTWSREQKRAIVAAANEPGAVKKQVAAEHGIAESLIYLWQKELAGDYDKRADTALDAISQRVAAIDQEIAALQKEKANLKARLVALVKELES